MPSLSAGLLQATLLDVFRRSASLAPASPDRSTDRSAADLVDGLIGQALQHQAVQHPYLHALGSGNLPDLPFALRDLARTPQGRFELAKGMHKALGLRTALWAWLHQRALSLSAMQG